MAERVDVAAEIREWMLGVIQSKGVSPTAWAKQAGIAGTTVQRAIKPDYAFVTSSRTLAKLAEAAGVEAPDFRKPGEAQIVPRFLPVRYRVQGGHWFETDGFVQDYRGPSQPVAPDPRFSEYPQWLEEVVGPSVNLRIPDGNFAHVVDAIAMGYAPRDGDFVVIERRRDGGHLRERTIKQVVVKAGKVSLWPRSTDPRWQEPITLTNGCSHTDDLEIEIVGLVIGAYAAFY